MGKSKEKIFFCFKLPFFINESSSRIFQGFSQNFFGLCYFSMSPISYGQKRNINSCPQTYYKIRSESLLILSWLYRFNFYFRLYGSLSNLRTNGKKYTPFLRNVLRNVFLGSRSLSDWDLLKLLILSPFQSYYRFRRSFYITYSPSLYFNLRSLKQKNSMDRILFYVDSFWSSFRYNSKLGCNINKWRVELAFYCNIDR